MMIVPKTLGVIIPVLFTAMTAAGERRSPELLAYGDDERGHSR
jgi:hypothetical protein